MSGTLTDWPHLFEPGDGGPVILALHGTGGDENQGLELGRMIAPMATVLAPRGRVPENGMNRWFRRHAEGVFDTDDVVARASDLADLVLAARDRYDLADRPLIAVGFSNGANMALALTLLHPDIAPTTVAFSARWPLGDHRPADSLDGTAIALMNGDTDGMAPLIDVERVEREAAALGADVSIFVRPGGHGLTRDDLDAATGWLATQR